MPGKDISGKAEHFLIVIDIYILVFCNTRIHLILDVYKRQPFFESVEPSTTNTKIKVNTASAMNACNISPPVLMTDLRLQVPMVLAMETKAKRIAEPIIAPITWKII